MPRDSEKIFRQLSSLLIRQPLTPAQRKKFMELFRRATKTTAVTGKDVAKVARLLTDKNEAGKE